MNRRAVVHNSDFTAIEYDACDRWDPQPPLGGTTSVAYSDEAGMVLTRVFLGYSDSAAQMTYNSIDNSMDSVELSIRMLALRSAYVYDHNVIARDTLRKYAFRPFDPDVPVDYITNTAVVNLIMAETLLDNVEGAIQAMDSVIFRTVPDGMRIHYLAKKAEMLVNSVGDSSYIAVIDSLLFLYPSDNDVLSAKYLVSRDTAYAIWYEKRGTKENISSHMPNSPVLSVYPVPAGGSQTIHVSGFGEIRDVILRDYLGRQIDKMHYQYHQVDDVLGFTYDLRSGVYFMTIVGDTRTQVTKIVINSEGAVNR